MKTLLTALAAVLLCVGCATPSAAPEHGPTAGEFMNSPCTMPLPEMAPDVAVLFREVIVYEGSTRTLACWRPVYGHPELRLIQFPDGGVAYVQRAREPEPKAEPNI